MATKIRLKRLGKIRSPHYRVVVMDSRARRDGQAIEELGIYHPKSNPSVIRIDSERAQYWLGVGAQPTEAVIALLKRTGDWQQFTGVQTPSGIDPQPEPVDKLARFNAALAEADGDPTTEAISRRGRKTEAPAQDAPAAEAVQASEETPAEEA
ncbi:MAG: 30S ribosomal protein S16 [Brooklawnia sp.]